MRYWNLLLPLFIIIPLSHYSAKGQDRSQQERLFHLVEEVRIGQLDGEEEYMFGRISGVFPGEDGKIIVADSQIPVIRMFDREGSFLKQVGGEGRGPGEYSYIIGIGAFPDGSFAISDPRNARVTIYDAEGEVLRSHIVQNGLYSSYVFDTDKKGHFYVRSGIPSTLEFSWLKYNREGEIVDTLIERIEENDGKGFRIVTPSGAAFSFMEREFSAISPLGYLVTGDNSNYRLEWGTEQNTITVERKYTPVELNPEEKKQWQKWGERYSPDSKIPDTKPAFKDILTDSQGRIWVWRYVEAELADHIGSGEVWWERRVFDVFLPDGKFFGTVELPWNIRLVDARDNQVWGVLTGEMDEKYAVRLRMEEMSSGE